MVSEQPLWSYSLTSCIIWAIKFHSVISYLSIYYFDSHLKLLMVQVDLITLSDVFMPLLRPKSIVSFRSVSISYKMYTDWIQHEVWKLLFYLNFCWSSSCCLFCSWCQHCHKEGLSYVEVIYSFVWDMKIAFSVNNGLHLFKS